MDESADTDTALERALSGDRPSLGERVDATRARDALEAAARNPEPPATGSVDPEPPPAGPPPPPGGVWIWVRQPEARGVLLCRAMQWERTASGAWALRVDLPMWAGHTVPGGYEIDAAQGWQIAPTHALITIPGQDYRRLPRP